ncbi:MAG: Gfo/Idh/MocA family oxidoreductase [Bdellovibrionales bacterium]|nr:Gfo/Idh/MocA family oxidoreductase [Bdellovibrionales bacterium]
MSKIKTAVIGVGYLGRFHAQKHAATEQCELVGVCDARQSTAEGVAEELGVKAFSDYKELKGQVDAVSVVATTSMHYEIAKFFLENNTHVFLEKPMTVNSKEAKELCELSQKNNLKLQVGHIERFNPALVSAKEKLKKPLFIECHRLAPFNPRGADVSVILDLMIHDLDVILSLVDSPVKSVAAVGTPVVTKTLDIANARVEFESGAVANITSSRVSENAQRKFRVFQKDQYLSIDFGRGDVQLITKTGEFSGDDIPIEKQEWSLEKGDALMLETQAFVDAVINDTPVLVSGEDGKAAIELAEQINACIEV